MTYSLLSSEESTVVNTVTDEKFVNVYTSSEEAAQLLDNGRTLVSVQYWFDVAALGCHSYSTDIHRIRIRVDKGIPFLGIRSRNIPPEPSKTGSGGGGRRYTDDSSTYGWLLNGATVIHGKLHVDSAKDKKGEGHIYTLTLDCDERQLRLVNENTNEQYKIKIDIGHAPFPWCLFVENSQQTGRLSLI